MRSWLGRDARSKPERAAFKLAHHHKVIPELQNARDDFEIRVLLKVVVIVEAARPPRLHVGYALPLDWPRVSNPGIAGNFYVPLILQH